MKMKRYIISYFESKDSWCDTAIITHKANPFVGVRVVLEFLSYSVVYIDYTWKSEKDTKWKSVSGGQ